MLTLVHRGRYERQGTEAELAQCQRELEKHNKAIADAKSRIANLQQRISQADQQLADSNAVLRNFNDNLRLRSEKRNLEKIVGELDALDVENAREMYRKFDAQYREKLRKQEAQQAKVRSCGAISPAWGPS